MARSMYRRPRRSKRSRWDDDDDDDEEDDYHHRGSRRSRARRGPPVYRGGFYDDDDDEDDEDDGWGSRHGSARYTANTGRRRSHRRSLASSHRSRRRSHWDSPADDDSLFMSRHDPQAYSRILDGVIDDRDLSHVEGLALDYFLRDDAGKQKILVADFVQQGVLSVEEARELQALADEDIDQAEEVLNELVVMNAFEDRYSLTAAVSEVMQRCDYYDRASDWVSSTSSRLGRDRRRPRRSYSNTHAMSRRHPRQRDTEYSSRWDAPSTKPRNAPSTWPSPPTTTPTAPGAPPSGPPTSTSPYTPPAPASSAQTDRVGEQQKRAEEIKANIKKRRDAASAAAAARPQTEQSAPPSTAPASATAPAPAHARTPQPQPPAHTTADSASVTAPTATAATQTEDKGASTDIPQNAGKLFQEHADEMARWEKLQEVKNVMRALDFGRRWKAPSTKVVPFGFDSSAVSDEMKQTLSTLEVPPTWSARDNVTQIELDVSADMDKGIDYDRAKLAGALSDYLGLSDDQRGYLERFATSATQQERVKDLSALLTLTDGDAEKISNVLAAKHIVSAADHMVGSLGIDAKEVHDVLYGLQLDSADAMETKYTAELEKAVSLANRYEAQTSTAFGPDFQLVINGIDKGDKDKRRKGFEEMFEAYTKDEPTELNGYAGRGVSLR